MKLFEEQKKIWKKKLETLALSAQCSEFSMKGKNYNDKMKRILIRRERRRKEKFFSEENATKTQYQSYWFIIIVLLLLLSEFMNHFSNDESAH